MALARTISPLINTLIDSMSMEDLQQYVVNDMADFLYNCNESEVLNEFLIKVEHTTCLLYTSPSPRDLSTSRMPSSA